MPPLPVNEKNLLANKFFFVVQEITYFMAINVNLFPFFKINGGGGNYEYSSPSTDGVPFSCKLEEITGEQFLLVFSTIISLVVVNM